MNDVSFPLFDSSITRRGRAWRWWVSDEAGKIVQPTSGIIYGCHKLTVGKHRGEVSYGPISLQKSAIVYGCRSAIR
ncbi:hypothetical protein ACVWYH_000018 [Bradyrhizobium sp. GM24.11]